TFHQRIMKSANSSRKIFANKSVPSSSTQTCTTAKRTCSDVSVKQCQSGATMENMRSEERRVGKEGRSRRREGHRRKKCGTSKVCFFFSSRRRHTRSKRDWSSDVCSSDLHIPPADHEIS